MIKSKIKFTKELDDKLREQFFKDQKWYFETMHYLFTHFVKHKSESD